MIKLIYEEDKKYMTKEEMIKQMSTEELASFLREMSENRIVQYADLEE